MKTTKDICKQTLRQLLLSLSEKEVKESLKQNEKKLTLKFNTYLILLKDIESVVQSTTITGNNIYGLHKPNDFVVHVDHKDGEDEDAEEEVFSKYRELKKLMQRILQHWL